MDTKASRELLYSLLGDLPPRDRPIRWDTVSVERHEGWVLERLMLDLNGDELVPACLTRPDSPGPHPAILYNHFHGGKYQIGKQELVTGFMPSLEAYGPQLARRGYIALCIDHYNFGERSGRDENALFKELIWQGRVLWGMMVYDSLKALDYLCARDDVDTQRLGTLGLSMGSTMGWWVAALDERVRVCADLCCMTEFNSLIRAGGLNGHGIYYYVPSLLKHFSTYSINALIYPRAHISLNGKYDGLTPYDGLTQIDAQLKALYKDCPENWRMIIEPHGHMETPSMRREVLQFLDGVLKPS